MTTTANKPLGFIAACRSAFGMHPGQTLGEFRDEVSGLTDDDRAELTLMLAAHLGVPVIAPTIRGK